MTLLVLGPYLKRITHSGSQTWLFIVIIWESLKNYRFLGPSLLDIQGV